MSLEAFQSGRTRLAMTVILVALIGGVGAFLLPVLVHETKAPVHNTFRAEVTFGVTETGLPNGGPLQIVARLAGGPLLKHAEPMAAGANGEAVAGLIADGIGNAGWPTQARPQIVGNTLAFGALTTIGGSPGRSGMAMSLAVSGRPGQSLVLRLGLEGAAGDGTDRLVVAIKVRGVVSSADDEVASPGIALQFASNAETEDVLGGLLELLQSKGWSVATDGPGALLIRTLPGEAPIGSAILSVGAIGAPTSTRLWTLELVP